MKVSFGALARKIFGATGIDTSPTHGMQIFKEYGFDLSRDVRRATVKEYTNYLREYVEAGHRPTHSFEHPFSQAQILIALRNTVLPAGRGHCGLKVIVPKGMNVSFEDSPYNEGQLYKMDNLTRPLGFVPVYREIIESIHREVIQGEYRVVSERQSVPS